MNVMYAADDNYVEIAGISIESLLANNTDINELVVYFVEDEISEINRTRLVNTMNKYGRKLIFIPKPDISTLCGTELLTLRWSDSAYSRLYLDLLFKDYPEVHKILYLDCDTLIMDSLCELWNENVDDYLGAAVLECMSNMHKRILGKNPKDNYVNTGMILFNVDRWKSENISKTCTDFIKKYKGKTEYVDQGVINGTVSNRFKIIDPRYNLTAMSWDLTYEEMQVYRKPSFGYDKETWEKAVDNPAVIHFTTSFLSVRPWFVGSSTPYTDLWDQYHDRSEWKDCGKKEKSISKTVKILKRMDRRIMIALTGFVHSYIKPLYFQIFGK